MEIYEHTNEEYDITVVLHTPDNGVTRVLHTPDNGVTRVLHTPDNGVTRVLHKIDQRFIKNNKDPMACSDPRGSL